MGGSPGRRSLTPKNVATAVAAGRSIGGAGALVNGQMRGGVGALLQHSRFARHGVGDVRLRGESQSPEYDLPSGSNLTLGALV